MGESDPETGRGIPQQDQFSSRDEERQFRPAVDHDPHVLRAVEAMGEHGDRLDEQGSQLDRILDELMVERKKPVPDLTHLVHIRARLHQEEVEQKILDQAQKSSPEQKAIDSFESLALDHPELANEEIIKAVAVIDGLATDIFDMAESTISESSDEYPQTIQSILSTMYESEEGLLQSVKHIIPDFSDSILDFEDLVEHFEPLPSDPKAKVSLFTTIRLDIHAFVDLNSKMMEAVDQWRREHHQKS